MPIADAPAALAAMVEPTVCKMPQARTVDLCQPLIGLRNLRRGHAVPAIVNPDSRANGHGWLSGLLERQADTGFEIAAIVTDANIATQVDDFVAEFHFDAAGKFTTKDRTIRISGTRRLRSTLRSTWSGAGGRLTGNRANLTDGACHSARHALGIGGACRGEYRGARR